MSIDVYFKDPSQATTKGHMETIDLTVSSGNKSYKVKSQNDWVSSTFEDTFKVSAIPIIKKRSSKCKTLVSSSQNSERSICANQMWVDRYKPQSIDELAVHRNKIAEVDSWLRDIQHVGSKVLVITGPVGCGKTATIKVVANTLDLTCKEWTNPVITPFETLRDSGVRYKSQLDTFHDFLFRCGRYSSVVDIYDDADENEASDIIVLEELPYVFQQNPTQLKDVLVKYQSTNNLYPLVLIVSDGNMDAVVRQLPPSIKHISFNSVATTLMVKTLKRIANSEGYNLSNEQAKLAASDGNGDIRASIFSLQFSLQEVTNITKSKISKRSQSTTLLQKDANVSIFRSVGKILYCKRQESSVIPASCVTTDRLVTEPEDVLEQCCLTGSTFASYLHHNYLPLFTKNDVCDVANASEYFSVSDLMGSSLVAVDPSHGASRMLDFYQGVICSRGLIDSNSLRKTHAGCTKASGSFNPLRKPAWTGVHKERADNYIVAQSLFWKFRQSSSELISSTLPYLLRLKSFHNSAPERMFLQKVITLSSNQYSSYNQGCHDDGNTDSLPAKPILPSTSNGSPTIDDEVDIQDFSD